MDQVIQLRKKTRHIYKERMYKRIIYYVRIFLKQIVFYCVGNCSCILKFWSEIYKKNKLQYVLSIYVMCLLTPKTLCKLVA